MQRRKIGQGWWRWWLLMGALCCSTLAQAESSPFAKIYPADLTHPFTMVAQRSFSLDEGYVGSVSPWDANFKTNRSDAALHPEAVSGLNRLGAFQRDERPVTMRVAMDVSSDAPPGVLPPSVKWPVEVILVCQQAVPACGARSVERLVIEPIEAGPQRQMSANPWSDDTQRFVRRDIQGVSRVLLKGERRMSVTVPADWKALEVYLAYPQVAPSSPRFATQLQGVHVQLIQGAFTETPLSHRQQLRARMSQWTFGPVNVGVMGLAMLFMLFQAWRLLIDAQAQPPENPPRLLGGLMLLWGWSIALMPVIFATRLRVPVDGAWYYLVLGLLIALSGLYALFGRYRAVRCYQWALLIGVLWSAIEFDLDQRQFYMQIGMPLLVGLYIWHLARSGRFDPA